MSDTVDQPPEQPQAEPVTSESVAKPKSKTRYWLVFLGVLIVFLAIPYAYTSNPKSCTRCHEMDKYYTSWKASSHFKAANNCFECHVKQGMVSLWIYRISFYREIYASKVGAKLKPAGASLPGVESCQRRGCHSLNRVGSTSGDLKINHRIHVLRAEVACTKCHPGAAHPRIGRIGDIAPKRKLCKECHQARMGDCAFCHTKKFSASLRFAH